LQVLTSAERTKINRDDDREWYSRPRLVQHFDDSFARQLTQLYRERIPADAVILDVCASHISHLPEEVQYPIVTGHGMNAAELGRNPRLSSFFVRDFNKEPDGWAAADCSYDAVLCCCSVQVGDTRTHSIATPRACLATTTPQPSTQRFFYAPPPLQYLQQPERVFAEIYRVLKPGGVVIISFTNRLFYEKAVAAWRDASGFGRTQLVKQYISAVRGFTEPEAVLQVGVPPPSGPVEAAVRAVQALFQRAAGDPFYAVIAYRNWKRVDE